MQLAECACPSCGQWIAGQFERRRVNTVQAAEIAGVSIRTIRNWVRANQVEWVHTPSGRGVRIYVDTLLKAAPDED